MVASSVYANKAKRSEVTEMVNYLADTFNGIVVGASDEVCDVVSIFQQI